MVQCFPPLLGRIVERLARLSPPRYRELVRGMAAELDSIVDPVEGTRFALGAIAAIARLTLSGYVRSIVNVPGRLIGFGAPENHESPGGPPMPKLTTRQLLGRHVVPFAVSFTSLTILLLANNAARRVSDLSESGFATSRIFEAVLLAVPHTVALTIPMAVFLAVLWAFARLGAEGLLATAVRERHGIRRVVVPVLGAAAVIAGVTFVSNAELVPRANLRLSAVLSGAPIKSDRSMTIGELRAATRSAQSASGADAALRAAGYGVEIQKKFALAAACVFLALAGAAIAIRFPRAGGGLVPGASAIVFSSYYFMIIVGESLAERQGFSLLLAMWSPNVMLLAVSLLLVWRPRNSGPARGAETLAIGG